MDNSTTEEIPVFDYCNGNPVPTVETKTEGPEVPDKTEGPEVPEVPDETEYPDNEDYEG